MKNWIETYPHKIYASVLLLDNKIDNWKVGQYEWKDMGNITNYWKIDRINDYTVKTTFWEVNSSEEHNLIFTKLSSEWFKQWELADDFMGGKPY